MMTVLTIIHVIISLALVIVVLMQHGKQQGLSGAIAGGAETFFGKNKGRTVDAMLKKFTAVVAVLFIVSSVVFAAVAVNEDNKNAANKTETTESSDATQAVLDENGNLVDAEGNILATAEDLQNAQAESEQENATEGEAEVETEAEAEAE